MYIPQPYEMKEANRLHALIWGHNFGTIFSCSGGTAMATHLPFLLDSDEGPNGTLTSHMARRNPQWQSWEDGSEVLVTFLGPQGYISPAWHENQVTVPTWNFAAVHVRGRPRLITASADLRALLGRLLRCRCAAQPGQQAPESQHPNANPDRIPIDTRHAAPLSPEQGFRPGITA